jgi:hypothetical protein
LLVARKIATTAMIATMRINPVIIPLLPRTDEGGVLAVFVGGFFEAMDLIPLLL